MTYYIAEIRFNAKSAKMKRERKMRKRLVSHTAALLFTLLLSSALIMIVPAAGFSERSEIIKSLEDFQKTVEDLPEGADGFTNPRAVEDKRKTLCNKIGAVINQIEAGNYKGAVKKLGNDVINSIMGWFVPPYRNDLIDEVEDIIKRIPKAHDVAVTGVSAPSEVAQGDTVTINVEVANLGRLGRPHVETFNVYVTYDATPIGTESVTLPPQDSTTLQFDWDTDGVPLGTYTITAEAVLAEDEDPTNNKATTTITIKEIVGVVHDVAVTDITVSPSEVYVGDPVYIDVTVANEGTEPETFDVHVYADIYTTAIGDEITVDIVTGVYLDAGTSTTLSVTWDTSGVAEDTYTISAEAVIAKDDDPADNLLVSDYTVTASLLLMHDVAVTGVSAPSEATKGDIVIINVDNTNLGDYDETFDITVTYDTNLIGTILITLNTQNSTTVPFSWDTSGVTPATYTITAKAIPAQDDDLTNNVATTSIIIGKLSSLITCSVSPDTLYSGDNVTVSGDIDPDLEGVTVTLEFTKPNGTSVQITTTSNSTGGYSIEYTLDMVGNWTVTASWPGDENHEGATSDSTMFTVKEPAGWPLAWLAGIALAVAALTAAVIYALYRRRKMKSAESTTAESTTET